MTKAKSRLRPPATQSPTTSTAHSSAKTKGRRQYLLLLIIGLINWVVLAVIVLTISPRTVQHLVVPHLYLPVLALFSMACFFSLAFILLHTRRALVVSLALTTLLFFRLQQFSFTWQLVGAVLIFFGILELSLTLIQKSRVKHQAHAAHHADIKPQAD